MPYIRRIYLQLMEMEADRDRVNQRLQQLQKSLGEAEEGKRGAHGRLASAQTALMLQEETIRRNEREQKSLAEKLAQLERAQQNSESDRRTLQVIFRFLCWACFYRYLTGSCKISTFAYIKIFQFTCNTILT